MRTIRKGNDISINWTVYRNEKEESFEGKTVNVYLCDKHGCKMPFTYSINNNIIQGIFYGKDQEILGTYSLVLVENEGMEDMVTLDYVDCFLLASKLKNTTTSGSDKDDELVTEVVSVQSIIDTTTSGIDLSKYALKSTVYTKEEIDATVSGINSSISDEVVKREELESGFNQHSADTTIHITQEERTTWSDKYTKIEADSKYQPIGDYAIQDKTYTKQEVEQIVATMQSVIDGLQTQLVELSGANALY